MTHFIITKYAYIVPALDKLTMLNTEEEMINKIWDWALEILLKTEGHERLKTKINKTSGISGTYQAAMM